MKTEGKVEVEEFENSVEEKKTKDQFKLLLSWSSSLLPKLLSLSVPELQSSSSTAYRGATLLGRGLPTSMAVAPPTSSSAF